MQPVTPLRCALPGIGQASAPKDRPPGSGAHLEFESVYHDIVAGRRIVYASTLSADDTVSTVSITTIEIGADAEGARLLLTEQATFLDGLEDPSWREQGTSSWLDALGSELGHR